MSDPVDKSAQPPAKTDEELYERAVGGEATDSPDPTGAEPAVESNSSNYGGSSITSERGDA